MIMVGVWLLPRRANIKEAANEYANEKYIDAYQTISAVSIKEDEQALYDKIVLCSKLERQIQSYQTNVSMDKNWKPFMRCFKDWICTIKNKTK